MPGLLRGMARTAVVAGTATAVSNRVSRRQANRWANDESAQAPAPASTNDAPTEQGNDVYVELEKLGQLKADGVITEEEFSAKKKQLLGL